MSDEWTEEKRKIREAERAAARAAYTSGKIIDLMEALKASLTNHNPKHRSTEPMTDTTIPPLTADDVQALGFTAFGFENEARMGAVVAHKDGEAFYLQRAASFWSIDPEYGNMRGVLCEEPPNWKQFRHGCDSRLIVDTDVLVWRVSDLPPERAARLFNYDTIAPVLAGLKAQTEPEPPIGNGIEHAPTAPTPRRPLKVGDRVIAWQVGALVTYGGKEYEVSATRRVMDAYGSIQLQVQLGDDWVWDYSVSLILDDPATTGTDTSDRARQAAEARLARYEALAREAREMVDDGTPRQAGLLDVEVGDLHRFIESLAALAQEAA